VFKVWGSTNNLSYQETILNLKNQAKRFDELLLQYHINKWSLKMEDLFFLIDNFNTDFEAIVKDLESQDQN
jgi:hypothetical protein